MEILRQHISLEDFFASLDKAEHRLLLLDYDGTLSPFTPDRDNAVPYPGIKELLLKILATRKSDIVIISGRSLDMLEKLIPLSKDIEMWGCHGAEQYSPSEGKKSITLSPEVQEIFSSIISWGKNEKVSNHLEQKPYSVAIHWRGLTNSNRENLKHKFLNRWETSIRPTELIMHYFDGGIEVKLKDVSKYNAVQTIINRHDAPVAAYLGDDLTDEDAFEALGDNGLKVLVSRKNKPTKADLRIEPPGELIEFLTRWLDTLL